MAWLEEPVSPTDKQGEMGTHMTRSVTQNMRIAGTEMENSDSGEEDEAWERPNIVKESVKPTKTEVDEHMVTHVPFRSWCPICVKGKSNVKGHYRISSENIESEVPVVSIDYMWMGQENGEEAAEGDGSAPILVIHDRRTKMKYARMVEAKGQHWYSQITLVRIIRQLGYNRIILKSDGERSIVSLKEEVAKELKNEHIEVVLEESPTGSSGSNGEVERAIREIQGQIRTMKIALESRIGKTIESTSNILPWMVTQAAALLSRIQKGADGRTAYERWKGKNILDN